MKKSKSPGQFPSLVFAMVVLGMVVASGSAAVPAEEVIRQESAPTAGPFTGELVSLKLLNASLVDFFRAISELSGLNILIDPDVKGTITINVEAVPWDQLFEVVLKSHRLEKSIEGNVVRISTQERILREEEATKALRQAAFLAEKTQTVSRRLNYTDAQAVFKAIDKDKAFLSERGELVVDERTNTIFVTDVSDQMGRFMSMLDTIDVPEPQVEIEARIIEASTNFARHIGVELGVLAGGLGARNHGGFGISAPVEDPIGTAGFITGKLTDTFRLDALITAAELEGEVRILSKPRVSAQNNAAAVITQGSRFPIPVQVNFSTNVRFETAALRLTVTPHITQEQTVALQIKLENNVPDFSRTVLGIPTILTSEAETRVLVPDGGTTMIGGIFVEVDRKSEDRVPGLSGIPVLGHLFKKTSVERETREILFFLTPKIKR